MGSIKMWAIFFILPDITLNKPVGNEHISIAPHDDSRVYKDIAKSPFAKSLVRNFEDQFGGQVHPSLLIINDNAPDSIKGIESIVGFRNAFALSTIIRGHEHSLRNTFVAYPLYSDYFDFYPITISKNDDGFITSSPSVLGFEDDYKQFRGQTSPGLAGIGSLSAKPDDQLFNLIERVWERRFIRGRVNEWSTRTLFRSLEMAYQATTMPYKNHSTIYDYGSSASLWVSAFEIISHPRQGSANLLSVLDLLGRYDWQDTRNDFLHGNPVRLNRLHPFKNKKIQPITRFAPLIYKVVLLSFLDQFKNRRKKADWQKEYISKLINEEYLSEAILKAKGS